MARVDVVGTAYLIHFETPLKHARHYIGWSENLIARIDAHRRGEGSALMAAVVAAGIDWRIARTWEGVTRRHERKLHNRHGTRLCPVCKSAGADDEDEGSDAVSEVREADAA